LILGLAGGGCAARQAPSIAPAETHAKGAQPAPPKAPPTKTIETADARLAAALAAEKAKPTPETLKAVATEYSRVGVFDRAVAYLTRAIALHPSDASLFSARARAYRDWGQPETALGDAHRATFLAPGSADAYNTLGTVQFALNLPADAVSSFDHALALAPDASWVLNNLCYVALIGGDEITAMERCSAALSRDPASTTARNNLALVHAAAGRLADARAIFLASDNPSAGYFNFGIILMSRRDYPGAADAFTEACRLAPTFVDACRRATDARVLAARGSSRPPQ
jgi:Flp pilus assembly protein TadD